MRTEPATRQRCAAASVALERHDFARIARTWCELREWRLLRIAVAILSEAPSHPGSATKASPARGPVELPPRALELFRVLGAALRRRPSSLPHP